MDDNSSPVNFADAVLSEKSCPGDSFFSSLSPEDQAYIMKTGHHFQSREEMQRFLYQRDEITSKKI